MVAGPPYSKNAVTRAGKHLAANLRAVRAGEREHVVDQDDPDDRAARDVVEWWLDEHIDAMLAVRERVVHTIAVTLEDDPWPRVTSRSKRADTVVDKLTRHPGALAEMVDLGGVRHGGRNIEVQARTEMQHRWANAVEQETLASGLNYKAGQGRPEVLAFFRELGAAYARRDGLPAPEPRLREALDEARPYLVSRTLRVL